LLGFENLNYQTEMKIKRWLRKPFITYILLALTIGMFVLEFILGGSTNTFTLIMLGAKVNELIIAGQWWRLITPMFLHIGLAHFLFNALILYFLGRQLEEIFGHSRFLLIYLASGILGNAFSFALNTSISAGASTALFGMFMSTIVLSRLYPNRPQIAALSSNFMILIIINVVFGLLSTGVDNAGHIGGLIGGYLISYAVSAPYVQTAINPKRKRLLYLTVFIIILILALFLGYDQTFYLNGLNFL